MTKDTGGGCKIYKITNTVNGKVYIGRTCASLRKRMQGHWDDIKRGRKYHLKGAMQKYGKDAFTIETLESVTKDTMKEREIYWIAEFNSTNPEIGYNMDIGGEGRTPGCIVSDEHRRKLSEAQKRRYAKPEEREKRRLSAKKAYAEGKCLKLHTKETHRKIADNKKAKYENDPEYRKRFINCGGARGKRGPETSAWGLTRSEETKKKISESQKLRLAKRRKNNEQP